MAFGYLVLIILLVVPFIMMLTKISSLTASIKTMERTLSSQLYMLQQTVDKLAKHRSSQQGQSVPVEIVEESDEHDRVQDRDQSRERDQ